MSRMIVYIIFAIILVACTTTDNPREGGLISGVASLESGAYEHRVESLRQRANKAREENIKLSERNELLNKQRDAGVRTLTNININISRISQQMLTLRRQIASKKTSKNGNRAELARIKSSIDGINSQIVRLKVSKPLNLKLSSKTLKTSSINPNTLKQLEKQKKELHEQYISLLELLDLQL